MEPASVLWHLSRCQASLFTERTATCRLRNGLDQRTVRRAVVVQRMVSPHAAGLLFSADPVTGNRTVATVAASIGHGETLVSGPVNPDIYRVRDGEIIARPIATRQLVIRAALAGRARQ